MTVRGVTFATCCQTCCTTTSRLRDAPRSSATYWTVQTAPPSAAVAVHASEGADDRSRDRAAGRPRARCRGPHACRVRTESRYHRSARGAGARLRQRAERLEQQRSPGQVVRRRLALSDEQFERLSRTNKTCEHERRALAKREREVRAALRDELARGDGAGQAHVDRLLDQLIRV